MSNKEQAKRIVDGVKERLKRETDPEQRRYLAVIGEEFNTLYLQLSGHDPVGKVKIKKRMRDIWLSDKVCTKCRKKKKIDQFSHVKQYYQNKKGEMVSYTYLRAMCNDCTWPKAKVKETNARRHGSFVVGGIRMY